ncbi:ubiquitin [Trifolium pratense]|uniref:Ubiquitin n=1 Tax=Trifolium pratense TaxID=57577 RepID=A0A2K3LM68_TRIPR|nr:ubiquitin [Trifolium pratense]
MPCPNAKHGCKEKIRYIDNRKHEEECIHGPCYCPLLGCDFVASSEELSNHFSHKHGDFQIRFSYGHNFVVSLKSNDETIVLQEENDGKLFILNNSTTILRNAVNTCCIRPNSFVSEYSYGMLARSQKCELKLQSFAKNVPQFTLATLSSEFLVIPFGSSKPLKLEICIYPPKIRDKEGFEVRQQRLIYDGKQLDDDSMTIADYNIREKSALLLVVRLPGS